MARFSCLQEKMMQDVRQCVFLVGGLGTRLGAYTQHCAKPMLDVDGLPFIVWLIRHAVRFGFSQIRLLAGYKGEKLAEYFAQHQELFPSALDVRVIVEPSPLGTGGALLFAREHLAPQFVLANGDSFFDCNMLRLLAPPLKEGRMGRMLLRQIEANTRYGSISVAGDIVSAMEPPPDTPRPGLINAGMYSLKLQSLDGFSTTPLSLESDILPALIARGQMECAVEHGYFIDIGIPKDLERGRREHVFTRPRVAVFFDRDGVLNRDTGYTHRVQDLRWTEGAMEAVRWCNDHGHLVFVVTNQAGVARGYYQEKDVLAFHEVMQKQLRFAGAHVDEFVFCPHHPEGTIAEYRTACACRKPAPGMVQHILGTWNIDREKSLLIGDKQSDLGAAMKCGIASALYTGGNLLEFVKTKLPQG